MAGHIQLRFITMGAIYLDCKHIRMDFSEDEIRLLRIISNQAAVALDNIEACENVSDCKEPPEIKSDCYNRHGRLGLSNQAPSTTKNESLLRTLVRLSYKQAL